MAEQIKLVETQNLCKYFAVHTGFMQKKKYVHAVENVSLYIYKGETFGLVGESGCGKTTFGRSVIRFYEPTSGVIRYDGKDIFNSKNNASVSMDHYHQKMQMIFQDPSASLDPRMTVGEIVGEPMDIYHLADNKKDKEEKVKYLLDRVGLNTEHANRFPHEFSGGQQQRIGIARALAVNPEFIVCDEPISALDVSIQAQIVNMLEDLQDELGLTYLFIAHDISVVRHISRRIGVMYLGSLVEVGESFEICGHPIHPYTQSLISAVPIPDPIANANRQKVALKGEIPSPMNPPKGCRFHTRCPYASKKCAESQPELKEVSSGHYVACFLK